MKRFHVAMLTAYAFVGIVTFGHAAADRQAVDESEFVTCKIDPRNICIPGIAGGSAIAGLIAAPLWPFYWSWTLFERSK